MRLYELDWKESGLRNTSSGGAMWTLWARYKGIDLYTTDDRSRYFIYEPGGVNDYPDLDPVGAHCVLHELLRR